jgi:diaminohydroxyphosphoribosylaminopyrimidine deaminase/5-amino-6-(5-phosphoribosylamino)uracil reductase
MSGVLTDDDRRHLRRCLRLAARGRWGAAPNPMVGAVVVRGGEVVGEGFHARAGGPHAEVVALAAAGDAARGATVYVSLEPCDHHGRTPPCTGALLAAGAARVVALHRDPDPRVAGGGFARLAAAGVEAVDAARDAPGLAADAVRLNLRYLVPAVLGRPLVTLKWAMSLDGRIATATGESQWITSPPARRWALALREQHDAIVVGSGTALADDPRLDRRLGLARRGGVAAPILRVVADRRLRLPPTARMLAVAGPVLVYTAGGHAVRRSAAAALESAGAEVVALDAPEPAAILADLHRRGVRSVLVEGGAELAAAWVAAGLYDRVHAAVAPRLIGGRGAPGALGGAGGGALEQMPRLDDLRVRRRGPDLVLTALRRGCLPELLSSVGAS